MPLIIQWTGGELLLDETKTAIVGRSDSVEITIKHQKISRHHLVFSFENGDWTARDLDTPNGSFLDAKRITDNVLPKTASITLGGPVGPTLSLSVLERLRPQEV